MKVFLTGATGFVGKHMVERLLVEGYAVRAALRGLPGQKARVVTHSQYVGRKDDFQWVHGDIVEDTRLDEGMQGCDAVIHLVGIIVEKGTNTFERVHHLGTRNVVEAAKRTGIKRFVQMSALGRASRWRCSIPNHQVEGRRRSSAERNTVLLLRPSLIFAEGDGFVTQMMATMRSAPLLRPVPGDGTPEFRPIAVEDVTTCFAR
jgi:uncharacterized protein YbjT (DUF2867 family)